MLFGFYLVLDIHNLAKTSQRLTLNLSKTVAPLPYKIKNCILNSKYKFNLEEINENSSNLCKIF